MGMNREPKICVGIDGSPAALTAVRWAASEAGLRRCSLEIVYVREMARDHCLEPASASEPPVRVMKSLHAARLAAEEVVGSAIKIHSEVTRGQVGPTLVRLSDSAALVVVGRTSYFHEMVAGSVAAFIAAHSKCPVVVAGFAGPHTGPVVIAPDGSDENDLVRTAISEAQMRGAELVIVHSRRSALALIGSAGHQSVPELGRAQPPTLIDQLHGSHPSLRLREVQDGSSDVLHELSLGAQLLVLRRLGDPFGGAPDSVAMSMVHRAACPVMILP